MNLNYMNGVLIYSGLKYINEKEQPQPEWHIIAFGCHDVGRTTTSSTPFVTRLSPLRPRLRCLQYKKEASSSVRLPNIKHMIAETLCCSKLESKDVQ